ncbi:MAG TPA: hypothetical protein VGM81_06315 [Burkholderiaceae bacterium]|jgi:MSHA biogenesis protein MshI
MLLFRRRPRHPRRSSGRQAPAWVSIAPSEGSAKLACVQCRAGAKPAAQWVSRQAWADPVAALGKLKQQRSMWQWRLVSVLEPGRYDVLRVDAPALPRTEWRAATRWMLADRVEHPMEDAALDVLEVPSPPSQHGPAALLAVTAPRANVQPLVRQAQRAGMRLHAVDIGETALRNIATLIDERPLALLHVDEQHSLLVIVAEGQLLLTRHLGIGLAQLADTQAPTRLEAAEQMGLELQRTLDGFERNFSQIRLTRLLVAPGTLPWEFMALAHDSLPIPVQALDLNQVFDFSLTPELSGDERLQSQYLIALGAALRS